MAPRRRGFGNAAYKIRGAGWQPTPLH